MREPILIRKKVKDLQVDDRIEVVMDGSMVRAVVTNVDVKLPVPFARLPSSSTVMEIGLRDDNGRWTYINAAADDVVVVLL